MTVSTHYCCVKALSGFLCSVLTKQTSSQFMRHAKRRKLTVEDLNRALRWSRVEVRPFWPISSSASSFHLLDICFVIRPSAVMGRRMLCPSVRSKRESCSLWRIGKSTWSSWPWPLTFPRVVRRPWCEVCCTLAPVRLVQHARCTN